MPRGHYERNKRDQAVQKSTPTTSQSPAAVVPIKEFQQATDWPLALALLDEAADVICHMTIGQMMESNLDPDLVVKIRQFIANHSKR